MLCCECTDLRWSIEISLWWLKCGNCEGVSLFGMCLCVEIVLGVCGVCLCFCVVLLCVVFYHDDAWFGWCVCVFVFLGCISMSFNLYHPDLFFGEPTPGHCKRQLNATKEEKRRKIKRMKYLTVIAFFTTLTFVKSEFNFTTCPAWFELQDEKVKSFDPSKFWGVRFSIRIELTLT